MSRKSANRPVPWLFNCANAATRRSRSPVVSVFAFLRTRTITLTEPTTVLPRRASMVTSRSLRLGDPNRPAVKNGTEVPLVGTLFNMIEFANAPVEP